MDIRDKISSKPYYSSLLCLFYMLCLFVFFNSLNERIDVDEIEHIHSAWYVKNGYIPYSDFFQHHHPLLWYSIAPLLLIIGNSANVIIVLRVAMFVLILFIVLTTYLLSLRITKSKEASLLSIVVLVSMPTFVRHGVQIRPDIPQVLFGLLSIYYLAVFLQTGDNKSIVFCGLSASISFLFLQKTIFVLFVYGLIFLYKLLRKQMSSVSLLCFLIPFLLPLMFYFSYLIFTDTVSDYVLTNWTLNIHRNESNSFFYPFTVWEFDKETRLFWLLSIFSVGYVLGNRRVPVEFKSITLLISILLLSIFVAKGRGRHYFIFPISLLCVPIGYCLKLVFEKFRLPALHRLLVIVLLIFPASRYLSRKTLDLRNQLQLEKASFVLHNSSDSDLFYDGLCSFNLFRPDLHYFWYSLDKDYGLDTYNKLTHDKYGGYNICELILSKKPKFISNYLLDITTCGLDELYNETRYNGLYIRRERD